MLGQILQEADAQIRSDVQRFTGTNICSYWEELEEARRLWNHDPDLIPMKKKEKEKRLGRKSLTL